MIERLRDREIDIAWLSAFRLLFGVTMCVSMLRFLAFGWIDAFFVRPRFHFKYWGLSFIEPLPGPWMHALFVVLSILGACIALGLFFRVAAWAFALGFAYLQLLDVATYLNHYYLASLLAVLLALSPAHRAFSIDALRKPGFREDTVSIAWLWLFRFQIAVVYTFAGLAKAQPDWLLHAQPLRMWLGSRTDLPLLGPFFLQPWAAPLMSWAGFLFDATIVIWLSWRKTRPYAYVLVVVFHALTSALFPIGMFPVIMVLGALLFFSPSWPRRFLAFFAPQRTRVQPPESAARKLRRGPSPLVLSLGLMYCALHVIMPLRHLAYGGSVLWDEQGMRWSWRVMVREKNGSTTFIVRDPRTGQSFQVPPRRYLTRLQEREMAGQPDLILQLSHHIRNEYAARLHGPVEVRVEALVSLNGRPAQALIDPRIDLARVDDGLAPAPFILAAPSVAPPHTKPI